MTAENRIAETPSKPRDRFWSLTLSALIVWQLIFMSMSTVGTAVNGPDDPWTDHDGDPILQSRAHPMFVLTGHWARVTLQTQAWSLFAIVNPQSTFPVVTLSWESDGSNSPMQIRLSSRFADGSRLPDLASFSRARVFTYEAFIASLLINWDDDRPDLEPEDFRQLRLARIRARWQPAFEFMTHRMNEFLATHPQSTPPTEVILSFDVIPTNPPSEARANPLQPVNRPFIRWRPGESATPGMLPVEAYDPQAREFKPVPRLP